MRYYSWLFQKLLHYSVGEVFSFQVFIVHVTMWITQSKCSVSTPDVQRNTNISVWLSNNVTSLVCQSKLVIFCVLTAQFNFSLPARLTQSKLLFLLLCRFSTIACQVVCKRSPKPILWNCNALRGAANSSLDPSTIIWYRQKLSILVSSGSSSRLWAWILF